jgi:hypothetical protein
LADTLTARFLSGMVMFTYNDLFESELKKLIQEEIDRVTENLQSGLSITDHVEYKRQVGKISGLRFAMELCEEAQKNIIQR